ncbi:MAG: serine/threonine-protein kinase [Polyangiales bacterium]
MGAYQPLVHVASGGMAEVYAALRQGEGGFARLVALKLLHRHLAGDRKFMRMFLDEARLAAQVHSPFVVTTLDVGRAQGGRLFLVMDWVWGVSLRQLVQRVGRRLPTEVVLHCLVQAAWGLKDVHQSCGLDGRPLHIVHRDLTPHNLLVGLDGCLRLADFGIAHAAERLTRSESGEVKGKCAYLAPEQLTGAQVDHRADQFSLGVIAWELLTGKPLFNRGDPFLTMAQVLSSPIAPLCSQRPDLPVPLGQVVDRALARNPAERFADCGALATALMHAAARSLCLPDPALLTSYLDALVGPDIAGLRERIHRAVRPRGPVALSALAPAFSSGVLSSSSSAPPAPITQSWDLPSLEARREGHTQPWDLHSLEDEQSAGGQTEPGGYRGRAPSGEWS